LLTFLRPLLLALIALSLILLTTFLAATASALSVSKAACSQQGGRHRDRYCHLFPISSLHYPLPFTLPRREPISTPVNSQVPFRTKDEQIRTSEAVLTERYDSPIDHIE
jgi:hypothetical protein